MPTGFRPPQGTRTLPLDLLRTQLVTREPARVSEAIAAWQESVALDRPAPLMLPRSSMQQGWKQNARVGTTGPMQSPTQAMHSLAAAMGAATIPPTRGLSTVPRGIPVRPMHSVVPSRFPGPGSKREPPAMITRRPVDQPLRPPEAVVPGPGYVPAPVAFHQAQIGLRDRWAAIRAVRRVAKYG